MNLWLPIITPTTHNDVTTYPTDHVVIVSTHVSVVRTVSLSPLARKPLGNIATRRNA
jgi:hypothetical protein